MVRYAQAKGERGGAHVFRREAGLGLGRGERHSEGLPLLDALHGVHCGESVCGRMNG